MSNIGTKILINNEIPRELWKDFVLKNPFSTLFQTPEFYDFYNSVPGNQATVLASKFSDQLVSLIIIIIQKENGIKGFFSKRGIIYGAPLIHPDFPLGLHDLLEFTTSFFKHKLIYLETRNLKDLSEYKYIFIKNNWSYLPHLNFQIKLNDQRQLEKFISSSRMRQIRKALKSGAYVKEAGDLKEVAAFYDILKGLYLSKVKKPLPSWDFFREFLTSGLGKYFLVFYCDKVIGGIMCPIFNDQTIYEFYVCGLDKEYKDQHPSVLATWSAIKFGSENKIKVFDFMGAGEIDKDYGVRDFKARFGGDMVEYGRFIKIQNHILYGLGKLGVKILSGVRI